MLTLDRVFAVDAAEPDCTICTAKLSARATATDPVLVLAATDGVNVVHSAVTAPFFIKQKVILSVAWTACT